MTNNKYKSYPLSHTLKTENVIINANAKISSKQNPKFLPSTKTNKNEDQTQNQGTYIRLLI